MAATADIAPDPAHQAALDERARLLRIARRRRRHDNLARATLLGLLLLVLPLVRSTALQDSFHLPKIIMAGWIMAAALVWWGWGLLAGRRFRLNAPPIAWAALAFWAVHVWGWLISFRSGSSAPLAWDRLGWVTIGLMVFLLFQDFARGRRRYILALGWLQVLSAFVTIVWVLSNDFLRPANAILRLPDWRGYLSAGLGNSGHIADWIALSFPTAILFLMRVRSRVARAGLIAHLGLGAMALIVCWSVHSNAGLIVALCFMLYFLAVRRRAFQRGGFLRRRVGRVALLVAVWIGAVAFYVLPVQFHPHQPGIFQEAFGSERWKEGGCSRLVIWGGSVSMIAERPILGWGTGNFTYGYPQAANRFAQPESPLASAAGQWTNAAHNALLQIWSELGLPGLLALIALVWVWFGAMRRVLGYGNPINDDIRLAATAMALMGCCHAMMNFVLQLPSFLIFYAGLAALPLCLVDRNRMLKENRMEFEFDFHWIQLIIRGEGMMAVTGLGFSLRPWPWVRWTGVAILVVLASVSARGNYRRFVAHANYKVGYEIVQHAPVLTPASLSTADGSFKRALEHDPNLVDAMSDRAKLSYRLANWDNVIEDTTAALERLQAPKLHFWRAEALLRLGDEDAARDELLLVLSRVRPWLDGSQLMTETAGLLNALKNTPPGRMFAQL